jgi:hypothetical protein
LTAIETAYASSFIFLACLSSAESPQVLNAVSCVAFLSSGILASETMRKFSSLFPCFVDELNVASEM